MLNIDYVARIENSLDTNYTLRKELLSQLEKYGIHNINFTYKKSCEKSCVVCKVGFVYGNVCHNYIEFQISTSSIIIGGVYMGELGYIANNEKIYTKFPDRTIPVSLSGMVLQSEFYNNIVEYCANRNKAIVNNNPLISIEAELKKFCDDLANNYEEKSE